MAADPSSSPPALPSPPPASPPPPNKAASSAATSSSDGAGCGSRGSCHCSSSLWFPRNLAAAFAFSAIRRSANFTTTAPLPPASSSTDSTTP